MMKFAHLVLAIVWIVMASLGTALIEAQTEPDPGLEVTDTPQQDNADTVSPTESEYEPGDCLAATFVRAGIDKETIPQYLEAFRNNEVDVDSLLAFSINELVNILSGPSFAIRNVGDILRLHDCLHDHGACIVQPYCKHGGRCEHVNKRTQHVCRCVDTYKGERCDVRIANPVADLQDTLQGLVTQVQTSGPVYTRWGHDRCNETAGASLLYSGWIAGTDYRLSGGSATPLCLPNVPEYGDFAPGHTGWSEVSFSEFETHDFVVPYLGLHNFNPTCAVCQGDGRTASYMFPARTSCPVGWTLEYHGYIFADVAVHSRTTYICVDSNPVVFNTTGSSLDGYVLYATEVKCTSEMPCTETGGHYDDEHELTCVVCSR